MVMFHLWLGFFLQLVDRSHLIEVSLLGRDLVDVVPLHVQPGNDRLQSPHRHRALRRDSLVLYPRLESHRRGDPEARDNVRGKHVEARGAPLPGKRREQLAGDHGRVHAVETFFASENDASNGIIALVILPRVCILDRRT